MHRSLWMPWGNGHSIRDPDERREAERMVAYFKARARQEKLSASKLAKEFAISHSMMEAYLTGGLPGRVTFRKLKRLFRERGLL